MPDGDVGTGRIGMKEGAAGGSNMKEEGWRSASASSTSAARRPPSTTGRRLSPAGGPVRGGWKDCERTPMQAIGTLKILNRPTHRGINVWCVGLFICIIMFRLAAVKMGGLVFIGYF